MVNNKKYKIIENVIKFTAGLIFFGYFVYQKYEKGRPPDQLLIAIVAILIIANMNDVISLVNAVRGNKTKNIDDE